MNLNGLPCDLVVLTPPQPSHPTHTRHFRKPISNCYQRFEGIQNYFVYFCLNYGQGSKSTLTETPLRRRLFYFVEHTETKRWYNYAGLINNDILYILYKYAICNPRHLWTGQCDIDISATCVCTEGSRQLYIKTTCISISTSWYKTKNRHWPLRCPIPCTACFSSMNLIEVSAGT